MAEKVLFTVTKPEQSINDFSGRQEAHDNNEFHEKNYQVALWFEDVTEGIVDTAKKITGVQQHNIKLWKYLDIDTPFFKECLIRKYIIPDMSFHFFHSDGDDPFPINYFTIEMKKVRVLQSKIIHFDISDPHNPPAAFNKNMAKPHIEELFLTASDITWIYKRQNEPRVANKSVQILIG